MENLLAIKPMKADIDNNTFITQFESEDVSIYQTPDHTIEGNEGWEYALATVSVKWEVYLEWRRYGIKDINAYSTQAQIVFYDDNLNKLLIVDTHDMDGWTIEDIDLDIRNNIYPKCCEIDVKDKSISIEW